jgi:hypothetical protein
MTAQKVVTSGGEIFTQKTYNGVSILVRDADGYVNASKMGNGDEGHQVRQYLSGKRFEEVCAVWSLQMGSSEVSTPQQPAKYSLLETYSNEVKGTYIHPDLVHFVAEWVDLEYTFRVQKIMNDLNRQLHSIMEYNGLPDVPLVAKTLLETAEVELKAKDAEIEELQKKIGTIEEEKKAVVEELTDEISNKSVRTDINNKELKIIELEDFYYVSGDQDYSKFERLGGKIKYVFWFLASMNMRQAFIRDSKKGGTAPMFEKEELKVLVKYLLAKDPKSAERWQLFHFTYHSP